MTLPLTFLSVPLAFSASVASVPRAASRCIRITRAHIAARCRAASRRAYIARTKHTPLPFPPLLSSLLFSSLLFGHHCLPPRAIRPTSARGSSRRGRGGRASLERNEPRPLGEVNSCSQPSTSSGAIASAREIYAFLGRKNSFPATHPSAGIKEGRLESRALMFQPLLPGSFASRSTSAGRAPKVRRKREPETEGRRRPSVFPTTRRSRLLVQKIVFAWES